ncbi:MAG: hypothetical protein ACFHVJ_05875 [Aestuariibacter sp.]
MKILRNCIALCFALHIGLGISQEQDKGWVITHKVNADLALQKQDLRNIYMGAAATYKLTPIQLPAGSETRQLFNSSVIGIAESRFQSFWSQMQFSGRGTPPEVIESLSELLRRVEQDPNVIAYVPANVTLPQDAVVIYRLR